MKNYRVIWKRTINVDGSVYLEANSFEEAEKMVRGSLKEMEIEISADFPDADVTYDSKDDIVDPREIAEIIEF